MAVFASGELVGGPAATWRSHMPRCAYIHIGMFVACALRSAHVADHIGSHQETVCRPDTFTFRTEPLSRQRRSAPGIPRRTARHAPAMDTADAVRSAVPRRSRGGSAPGMPPEHGRDAERRTVATCPGRPRDAHRGRPDRRA